MTDRIEIDASEVEHEFGIALVEAARALFSHVGQDFSPETRARVKKERAAGASLSIAVQLKPTPLTECLVESVEGKVWTLFTLVPLAT